MEAYILRVCCCAVIAGVIRTVSGTGPGSHTRNLIIGLFLAFAVISPLREISPNPQWELPEELYQEGLDITADATDEVNREISDIIIEKTRAYILDEADSLGAGIRVTRLRLDPQTLMPDQVELTGNISPYAKAMLSDYLENTLGIGKEAQIWTQ